MRRLIIALLLGATACAPAANADLIASPRAKASADTQSLLRWQGAAEEISAKSYLIHNPMVYLAEGAPAEDEASCINLSLEVGKPAWLSAVTALGSTIQAAKLQAYTAVKQIRW